VTADLDRPGRLLELAVVDLALIDRLRVSLAPGLNVITGETGAGKSLLIDALGLAIGARADTSLVRHGAEGLRVEALFDRLPEPLIAVREVAAAGRSTARIDDETVTVARLAETVGPLVEIHGQHEQQRLLDERWQRDVLDAYGGHAAERAAVAGAVDRWRANRAVLLELSLDPREVARRLEVLEHEIEEIEAAGPRPGEIDELRGRLAATANVEALAREGRALRDALVGEGQGARDRVGAAHAEGRALARIDQRFEAIVARLAGLEGEITDVAAEVRGLVEGADVDPAAIAAMEERLSLLYGLERRYGPDLVAVLAHAERAALEVERLRGIEEERTVRAAEDARLLEEIAASAAELSRLRTTAAARLAAAVSETLESLGFDPDVFSVAVGRRPAERGEPAVEVDGDAVAFDAAGIDLVVFRFAPNPGEPSRPLARIASGGEMSRVALAVKQVLASADATPTLVFDEIDSGIGGRNAEPIGRSLWALGRRHQVLCVTHLPQIAAYADAHFRITKQDHQGRTVTRLERLEDADRVGEIAQMLGGTTPAGAAVAGARELLEGAERWRSTAAGVRG